MFKRILLPLDNSQYSKQAIRTAIHLAKLHDATVTGLVILDVEGIGKSIGSVPAGASFYAKNLEKGKIKEADNKIKVLLKDFEKQCKEAEIKYELHERQGMPSTKILEESMFYDLLLVGNKTYYEFGTDSAPGSTFDYLLDHSTTPILSVPISYELPNLKRENAKILLCFDGSVPSCRAMKSLVHLSSPFIEDAEVHIVMSHDYEKLAGHYLTDAKKYLASHNFKDIHTIYTQDNIIRYIDENYINWPDYIFIGAHSQKSLIDFITGSFSKFLFKNSHSPIFISQ